MKINVISLVILIFFLSACSSIQPELASTFTPIATNTLQLPETPEVLPTSTPTILPESTALEITATSKGNQIILKGFKGYVFWLVWSKDGKTLFIATEKSGVVIYDVVNKKVMANVEKDLEYGLVIQNIALSSDEKTLASVIYSKGSIRLINLETGDLIKTMYITHYQPGGLAFSPDGKVLASVNLYNNDRTITLWDVATGTKIKQLFTDNYPNAQIWFTPDGKSLIAPVKEGDIGIWDTNTGKLQKTFHCECSGRFSFSPDGEKLAGHTGVNEGSVWDFKSGKKLFNLNSSLSWITAITFDPSGRYLAVSGGNGGNDKINNAITIWDANTGKQLYELITGYYVHADVLAFSPDGNKLASGGYAPEGIPESEVVIWSTSQP